MLHPDEVFNIKKNNIVCNLACELVIIEKEYDERSFVDSSRKITLPGIFQFYVPEKDEYTQLTITYLVDLMKNDSVVRDKGKIIIKYEPGDIVITKDYVPTGVDMGLLIRLLQGGIKYIKDPKILLNMLHDIIPDVDLVHIELIVSNMFRDSSDLSKRCRLNGNYDKSEILGQIKQPFQNSWATALSFQYIDKAIKTGLVQHKDAEENPIEKVLYENFKEI